VGGKSSTSGGAGQEVDPAFAPIDGNRPQSAVNLPLGGINRGCGQIHGEREREGKGEEKKRRRREILAAAAAPHLRLLFLCSSSPAACISRQSAPAPVRPHLQLLHISPCSPFSVDWPDLQSLAVRTCSPASVARLPARLQYTPLCSQALCSALRLCSVLSIVCTSLCLCVL